MKKNKINKKIHIGTSGWHYIHWKGYYYPEDLSPKEFLHYYIQDFPTVEINNTFYKLPQIKILKKWKNDVPQNFIFSVKASRYITHIKRLKAPKSSLRKFLNRIKYLEEKLGVILFQLPPKWSLNIERLTAFLGALPKKYRYAFEFRDPSWLCEPVYELLREHNCALCIYEIDRQSTPFIATADFVYIRLHGPKGAYQGNYSKHSLRSWAKEIRRFVGQNKEIFCYFDNDEKGYAAKNAAALAQLLS